MNAGRVSALNIYVIIMVTIILADHKVLGMPAPSSGPVVALMLNMMEGFNWTKNSVSQPETYQQMIEVRRPPHFFFDLHLWTVGMQGWGSGGWGGGSGGGVGGGSVQHLMLNLIKEKQDFSGFPWFPDLQVWLWASESAG